MTHAPGLCADQREMIVGRFDKSFYNRAIYPGEALILTKETRERNGPRLAAIILAGGKGTRMRADRPKVLLELAGKPLLRHIADACRGVGVARLHVVVGEAEAEIRAALGANVCFHRQEKPLGTGHALMTALAKMDERDRELLVLMGDAPLLTPDLLKELVAVRRSQAAAASILTAVFEAPPPYGRVIRDETGAVLEIVEEFLCTPSQKSIQEVFTSPYCLDRDRVEPFLAQLRLNPEKGEYNLTDLIGILTKSGQKVCAVQARDAMETLGLNTAEDHERARLWLRARTERNPRE